jgi:hypothetical protein
MNVTKYIDLFKELVFMGSHVSKCMSASATSVQELIL